METNINNMVWISLHSWQEGNGKAKDIKWPEISLNLKNTSPPPSIYNKQYGNGSVTCISFLKYPFDICFVMIYHHVTANYRELPITNEVTLPSGYSKYVKHDNINDPFTFMFENCDHYCGHSFK